MEPLQALQNLYNAVRQVPATAEIHDKLKECALIIEAALKTDKPEEQNSTT